MSRLFSVLITLNNLDATYLYLSFTIILLSFIPNPEFE